MTNNFHKAMFEKFCADVQKETLQAIQKFPAPNPTFAALVEEVGELTQALLHIREGKTKEWHTVYKEAVQVAAMACRLWVEGDQVLNIATQHAEPQPQIYEKKLSDFLKALMPDPAFYIRVDKFPLSVLLANQLGMLAPNILEEETPKIVYNNQPHPLACIVDFAFIAAFYGDATLGAKAPTHNQFIATDTASDDDYQFCEGCADVIKLTDPHQYNAVDFEYLCENCAHTWQDFKDNPNSFYIEVEPLAFDDGAYFSPHYTAESAEPLIAAHLENGGKLTDKFALITPESSQRTLNDAPASEAQALNLNKAGA